MADNEIIQWAHRYAGNTDMGSLNHARDFLMKGLRDDVDTYVLLHDEPEYGPMFLRDIEESLGALQLVANGIGGHQGEPWDTPTNHPYV